MRLFIALDIPADIRERMAAFMEKLRRHAPDVRWLKSESLHVTLKFLGEVKEERLGEIQNALRQVKGAPFSVSFKGTGFFPGAKSARVFWIGVEAPPQLASLAQAIDAEMNALGFEAEQREFSPHLTLARAAGHQHHGAKQAGRGFAEVQKALASGGAAEFGTMTAEEFFLFQSRLSPKGASYTKLAPFALRPAA